MHPTFSVLYNIKLKNVYFIKNFANKSIKKGAGFYDLFRFCFLKCEISSLK